MLVLNFRPPLRTFTTEDCLKMIRDFHEKNKKVPTIQDLKSFYRQNPGCPSYNVFVGKGGLNHLIERAGFKPINLQRDFERGEVFGKFRNFVIQFRKEHDGKFPCVGECEFALGIYHDVFKRQTGMTYAEGLEAVGRTKRRIN